MTVDQLKSVLKQATLKVSFIKKDGSERTMICTTNSDVIKKIFNYDPEDDSSTTKSNFKYNENQIRVLDLEKHQWRSFRFQDIINIEDIKNGSTLYFREKQ